MQLRGPAVLFCPADRPDRFAKALAAADVVILDLEDAVREQNKDAARAALARDDLDPERVIVRVNGRQTPHCEKDLDAAGAAGLTTIMLPKCESVADVDSVGARFDVVALCETPRGVLNAAALAAHESVFALMLGAEDLAAASGANGSRDEHNVFRSVISHARSRLLLAAASVAKPAIDTVFLDLQDTSSFALEAREASQSGFAAKACIHPSQVAAVRDGFTPDAREVEWARGIVEAAAGGGVSVVDGRMVDAPVLASARRILRRAAQAG